MKLCITIKTKQVQLDHHNCGTQKIGKVFHSDFDNNISIARSLITKTPQVLKSIILTSKNHKSFTFNDFVQQACESLKKLRTLIIIPHFYDFLKRSLIQRIESKLKIVIIDLILISNKIHSTFDTTFALE